MPSAREAAHFLLRLSIEAARAGNREAVSNQKLQSLLYYAQGWSLAAYGSPLFDDDIKACKQGPVVSAVYEELERDGLGPGESSPSAEHRRLLRWIWEEYGDRSAADLGDTTRREPPWLLAHGGGAEIIPRWSLETHFQSENRKLIAELGLTPEDVERMREAERQVAAGEYVLVDLA